MQEPLVTLIVGEGAVELSEQIAGAVAPGDGVHLVELRRVEDRVVPADELAVRIDAALRARSGSGKPIPQVLVAMEDGESILSVAAALVLLDARRVVELDCMVIAVHGPAATVRIASGHEVVPASMAAGLAIADRVMLGGADRLTSHAFTDVALAMRRVNRLGTIFAPAIGGLPVGGLVSTGCWADALRIGPPAPGDTRVPGRSVGPALQHGAAFTALSFDLPASVVAAEMQSVVERLVARWPDVLRVQAVVREQHGRSTCVRAVGSRFLPSGRVAVSCRPGVSDVDVARAGGHGGTVTVVGPAALRRSIEQFLTTEIVGDGVGPSISAPTRDRREAP